MSSGDNLNEDFVINLQNTNEKDDDMVVIQLQSSKIQIPYYQLCKHSQLIQNEYVKSTAQERLSREVKSIRKKYKMNDSSIIIFFNILKDEEVKITNDHYHDLFKLSEIFQVRSLIEMLQNYSKKNFKDVHFIINSILKENQSINESTFNNCYLAQMEELLSDHVDECYQNDSFGKLNVSVVYRIIQKSYEKNKINPDSLYEFIKKSISKRFPLFSFINVRDLSKNNFDDLYNNFNDKKETNSQFYYQYLPVDLAFIKQLKDFQIENDKIERLQASFNQLQEENKELNRNHEKLVKENIQLKCQVQMLSPKREEVTPIVLKKETKSQTADQGDQNYSQLNERNLNQREINLDAIKAILANFEKRIISQGKGQTLLHLACESKNIQIVKYVLSLNSNIDVNSCYSKNDQCSVTALQIAIQNNDIEIVQLLLEQKNIDVNSCSAFYEKNRDTSIYKCPLHTAVEDGNVEILSLLLAHKDINVNAVYSDGEKLKKTALHIAIENNRSEYAKLLLNHPNIDVNIVYINNESTSKALDLAIQKNNIEVICSLLSFPNLDINFILRERTGSKSTEKTAFLLAVENNQLEIAQLLLAHKNIDANIKRKINTNYSTQYGNYKSSDYIRNEDTALYIATQNQNIELIQLLIDQSSIDPNILSSESRGSSSDDNNSNYRRYTSNSEQKETSALYWAIGNKKIEIVKILTSSQKVNLNIKYKSESSKSCSNNPTNSYSSSEPRETNEKNSEEKSALLLATQMQDIQIIKLLLANNNIDINSLCKCSYYSSSRSKKQNYYSSKEEERKREEDINSLYLAVKLKNFEIVNSLLSHPNIDVNAVSIFNYDHKESGSRDSTQHHFFTPLHLAIKEGNQGLIIMFMKHAKIDINAKDDDGKSPIELMNDEQMLSLISCLNK